jgi:hypothetical protein
VPGGWPGRGSEGGCGRPLGKELQGLHRPGEAAPGGRAKWGAGNPVGKAQGSTALRREVAMGQVWWYVPIIPTAPVASGQSVKPYSKTQTKKQKYWGCGLVQVVALSSILSNAHTHTHTHTHRRWPQAKGNSSFCPWYVHRSGAKRLKRTSYTSQEEGREQVCNPHNLHLTSATPQVDQCADFIF